MTTPEDLRVGDAERDAVAVALHDHFAQGRLDRAELDDRLGATLSAKTMGELRKITRDLPEPTGLPAPAPGRPGATGAGARAMEIGRNERMWAGHRHRPHRWHHHRRGPLAFAPLMLLFVILTFTVNPGLALVAVVQAALLVWLVRALFILRGHRS